MRVNNLLPVRHFPSPFSHFPHILTSFLSPSTFQARFLFIPSPFRTSSRIFHRFTGRPVLYPRDPPTSHTYTFHHPIFHPCVQERTDEETSKKSISFNHACTGKLNYPPASKGRGVKKMEEKTEPSKGVGLSRRGRVDQDPLMIGYNGAACTTG